MKNLSRIKIKDLAWDADLKVDSSIRLACPFCGGGQSKEESFSITRSKDGLLYNCFRDQCREHGFISLYRHDLDVPGTLVAGTPRSRPLEPYRGLLRALTDEMEGWWLDRFEIPSQILAECGVSWAPKEARYYLPIRGPHGRALGYSLRTFYPKAGESKVLTFKEDDGLELMGWYISNYENTEAILVEDQVSAMKLFALNLNSISLIGTHLNTSRMYEILGYFSKICIALDKDATQRALTFREKFGLFCTDFRVQILERDVKDTSFESLRGIFKRV